MKHVLLAFLVLCGVSGPALHAQTNPPRKLALLVGVGDYKHSHFEKLRFPENDISELADVLRAQKYEVVELTSSKGRKSKDQLPTAPNIRAKLNQLLAESSRDDLIIVGLAGHGLQLLNQRECYFCPYDANPSTTNKDGVAKFDDVNTLISINEILEILGKSGIGDKILLVDACRSDPKTRGPGIDTLKHADLPGQTGVLLSCSAGELAFESEKLGIGHGVFFYHVIEGLKKDAANRQNEVTWGYLSSHVQQSVPATVKRLYGDLGADQNPQASGEMRGVPKVLAMVASAIESPQPLAPLLAQLQFPFNPDQAQQSQKTWAARNNKKVEETNSVGMKLIFIPPGQLNVSTESGSKSIDKSFHICTTEVTQKQWQAVMGSSNSPWEKDSDVIQGDDYPASCISYEMAVDFCERLTQIERKTGGLPPGCKYRLPTELEWKWACRGGKDGLYNFTGDDKILSKFACFGLEHANAVGGKLPNAFGLFDTLGNVSEWCAELAPSETSSGSSRRVARGGSWQLSRRGIKVDTSNSFSKPNSELGFRPLKTH